MKLTEFTGEEIKAHFRRCDRFEEKTRLNLFGGEIAHEGVITYKYGLNGRRTLETNRAGTVQRVRGLIMQNPHVDHDMNKPLDLQRDWLDEPLNARWVD